MKHTTSAATMAAVIAVAAMAASAPAQAQTKPVQAWTQQQEPDPAKRVPPPPQEQADATVAAPAQAAPAPAYDTARPQVHAGHGYEDGRGGFFLGVKGGKGWVYDDVDQSAREVNAGYRWQAGAVTLVGIELARGRLASTTEGGWRYGEVDYGSIGVNARFNFGTTSPVYGLVRAGYWSAEGDVSGADVDGGYFGVGLGVDFNRHVNMSLVYTNHVYFDDYDYYGDDIHRADTLMLGAEVRF